MFEADAPCCPTLAGVLDGPGGGATPTVFVGEDDVMMLVVAMVDTPGGMALFDYAVLHCPFRGTELHTSADLKNEATS